MEQVRLDNGNWWALLCNDWVISVINYPYRPDIFAFQVPISSNYHYDIEPVSINYDPAGNIY